MRLPCETKKPLCNYLVSLQKLFHSLTGIKYKQLKTLSINNAENTKYKVQGDSSINTETSSNSEREMHSDSIN